MRNGCLDTICTLADSDRRVVFVGFDMAPDLLRTMQAAMPDRCYVEGVTGETIVGLAASKARDGQIPYAMNATFFTRRSFEQIATDVCSHNLPVRLISHGAGLLEAPLGASHLAIEDIAMMRALPNMAVVAVCDSDEMARLMLASLKWPGPIYIRLAHAGDSVVSRPEYGFKIGRAITMRRSNERHPVAVMSTGAMTKNALAAADILAKSGHDVSIVHFHTVKPLDVDAVLAHARAARLVVTIEEGIAIGGFGSAITDLLVEKLGRAIPHMKRIALPDAFPKHDGGQSNLFEAYGLMPDQIAATVKDTLGRFERAA